MTYPDSSPAIATFGLGKRYAAVEALSDLTLTVPRGCIYGFLGPNGAGKTTTIRMLLGFARPTTGGASLLGHDCWRDGVAARRDLGYLVPGEALYPDMSGAALLDFAAELSGRRPILRHDVLDALELSRAALGRRLGTYSKGMRQKLALTAAIQGDPDLLILDEPSDGLDPLVQRAFEEILRGLNRRGRTVFMSSHDLGEVERLCEIVAVVRGGRLLAEERIDALKRRHRRSATVVFRHDAPSGLDRIPGVVRAVREGHRADLAIEGDIGPLLRELAAYEIADLLLPPPRLEDIFMVFYASSEPAGERDAVEAAAR